MAPAHEGVPDVDVQLQVPEVEEVGHRRRHHDRPVPEEGQRDEVYAHVVRDHDLRQRRLEVGRERAPRRRRHESPRVRLRRGDRPEERRHVVRAAHQELVEVEPEADRVSQTRGEHRGLRIFERVGV